MAEFVGSYIFNRGQSITIWKQPKTWRASIQVGWRLRGYPFRYIQDKDKQRLVYRAMAILKKDLEPGIQPILREWEGEPLPIKVRTEDEEVEEFAERFVKEYGLGRVFHPSIFLAREYGPEYQVDIKSLGDGS